MENMENQKISNKSPTLVIFFLTLVSLFLLAAAVYFWFAVQSLQRHVYRLHNEVNAHQKLLISTQTTLQNLTQPQEKRVHALTEAEYLVQLANLTLNFEANVPLAVNLLKTADQQLGSTGDSALVPVRQALNNDITALQAVPKTDLAGLLVKLNAISQQIPQLPIIPTELNKPAPVANQTTAITQPAWKRGLEAVSQALSNVVVVRHLEQPVTPLLPPEQQAYLTLNIQLKLSEAGWAALHQQPDIYQQSLQQVIAWTQQYFIQSSAATKSVIAQLMDLEKTTIKPVLPSITASLNAIQSALNALANKTP